jgi:creatinine amidohydrolase
MSDLADRMGVVRRIDQVPWQELTDDARGTDAVVVPIGCVEPHGRHAPLGTDTLIAQGIADELGAASGAFVFPAIPLGSLNLLYDFREAPGAISLDSRVLIDVYTNLGTELIRQGFRRIMFVNGHSGNGPLLQVAAFDIKERAGGQIGILEWWAAAREVIDDIKGHSWGTHADEIETSILMAAAGEHLVDLEQAVTNSSELEDLDPSERSLYQQKILFTRKLDHRWIGESKNMGDPSIATMEHGRRIVSRCVEVGLEILDVLTHESRLEETPNG